MLFSCKKEITNTGNQQIKISKRLNYIEDKNDIIIHSGKHTISIPRQSVPLKKVIILNASLLGYISEIEQEDKIIGLSSPEYVYSQKIRSKIEKREIHNVGNEQKYDIEKIIALKPDVIFTNYISTFESTYDVFKKNGIKVVFLDEYLENNPLEKSAYLKLFSVLFGVEKKGNTIYSEIEQEYNLLKSKTEKLIKPTVICSEMYGNKWFMPGGKTFAAQYFNDAGANYILKGNSEEKSIPLNYEEVYAKSKNAQFWVNISGYKSKKELLMMNSAYQNLKVFKNGKLFSVAKRTHGKANDYFQSGVVRADKILKDYINIFHPNLLEDQELYYMQEIK